MGTAEGAIREIPEFMEVTYKHQDYAEQHFEGGGHLSKQDGFFRINPKYRELGGHRYYMAISFKWDLGVGEYELVEDGPVRAYLAFDDDLGNKRAGGRFTLTKVSPYPEGEFQLVEGELSAVGTFTFRR